MDAIKAPPLFSPRQHKKSQLKSEGRSRIELSLVRAIFAMMAGRRRSKISARSRAISRVIPSLNSGTLYMVDRGISQKMREPFTVAQTFRLVPSQRIPFSNRTADIDRPPFDHPKSRIGPNNSLASIL